MLNRVDLQYKQTATIVDREIQFNMQYLNTGLYHNTTISLHVYKYNTLTFLFHNKRIVFKNSYYNTTFLCHRFIETALLQSTWPSNGIQNTKKKTE